MAMLEWLHAEWTDRDRRMNTWYSNRGAVEAWERYAPRCATWKMIVAAFQAMNAAGVELNDSMEAIVGGREAEFEKLED